MLPSFTYLSDVNGIIFYSVGINSMPHEDFLDVTLVYYPDEGGSKVKREGGRESKYTKYICHGRVVELPDIRNRLPREMQKIIEPMFKRNPFTGEQFLSLERNRIERIFSPEESLEEILDHEGTDRLAASLEQAIAILVDLGIQRSQIGLYGGLQCGIQATRTSEFHDLDLLIKGLAAYNAVVQASSRNNVDISQFPDRIASNPKEREVAIRRGQISQFKIWRNGGTVVDVRICRRANDLNYYAITEKEMDSGSDITIAHATVTESQQALCLPCGYRVRAGAADYVVSSRYYHHVGAAHSGDSIALRGRLIGKYFILLTDPDDHYIVRIP